MLPRVLSLLSALAVFALAAVALGPGRLPGVRADDPADEAPAGYTLVTNGFTDQATFDAAKAQFMEDAVLAPNDESGGGLGPTYNAPSCVACHSNPVTGGSSQIFEVRATRANGDGTFTDPPGGTLVRSRAVEAAAQQRVPEGHLVTKRRSTDLHGLGFVEFVADQSILNVLAAQPADMRGTAVMVTVATGIAADGTISREPRIGRFGWKCQQGSLLDFAADADLNEKGITSPLQPNEALAVDGRSLSQFDRADDPEDPGVPGMPFGKDITAYTRFMRSLRAPPRDFSLQATDDARAGERTFTTIGCAVCHVPTLRTAPAGSAIRGFGSVPAALGGKTIHPFSDFLLHDIGSGETEVIQGGGPETRKMLRTMLLWGLRTRPELGHDGRWLTVEDAIQGHAGQAVNVRAKYRALTTAEQRQLKAFLSSL